MINLLIIDRIAMSVERVHIMSPPPHGRLYPDLSLVEDNKNEHNTSNTQLENLVTGCKVYHFFFFLITTCYI